VQISVIIPTYNRVQELKECLDSILMQTILPKEVLIVDNSDREREKVKKFITSLKLSFINKNIHLKYISNRRENALTVARNLGIKHSSGDIISFLDDDIILDGKYYEEIIEIYKKFPNALGVEGKIIETIKNRIRKILWGFFGRLFYLGFREKNKCRLLPSLGVTYLSGDEIAICEWLSGASTYRRRVFNEFKYDENLKKYSWGEDSDLSYRVFKKYPHSLYIAPQAKYLHKVSPTGRIPKREISYMEEIYYLYLFYKIIDQSFKNKLIYLWSRIGRLIFKIVSVLVLKRKLAEIKYSFEAIVICLNHLREIKNGDLEFFNKTLK
jgi:GT2 family glycosyltransferase